MEGQPQHMHRANTHRNLPQPRSTPLQEAVHFSAQPARSLSSPLVRLKKQLAV